MGQCASNKAKGTISVKKIIAHKQSKKMDRHKNSKVNKDEDCKLNPMGGAKENGKPSQKYTRGVAMSFGFKKRPTPMTTNNTTVAWDTGTINKPDTNGNKDEATGSLPRPNKLQHKITSSQNTIRNSITPTPKPARFGFPQTNTERTNKVGDIKSTPMPLHFAAAAPNRLENRRTSPGPEAERAQSRTVTIVTRTEVTRTTETMKDRNDNSSGGGRGGAVEAQPLFQTGKFTFQTTRLPQPEPIRVIETKTAKTIANNNKRSARLWRQYEEASQRTGGLSNGDSGLGSNGTSDLPEEGRFQNRNSGFNNVLETSDSFSEACTPPPLPKLPSAFKAEKEHLNLNKNEGESKKMAEEYNSKKMFLKSSATNSLLKRRGRNVLDRDSPQSSSDQEWINGGEAMADDDVSLSLNPKPKPFGSVEQEPKKVNSITDSLIQSLLEPTASLDMIDSLKDSMNLSLEDEDPHFTAVVTNNNTGVLLDDEILSPVESILSSSESDPLEKNKPSNSTSNSKDVNEKLTPTSPPGSPSNATYSLSLSDDKEDFLIDDEIADQPELVFEERRGRNVELTGGCHQPYGQEEHDLEPVEPIRTSYKPDFSPLPLRKQKIVLQRGENHGSFDSLSPCDSIGSEDLMMDYDISQTNDVDVWERDSGSVGPIEGTPKSKFKADDSGFRNKSFYKNLTTKHSVTSTTNSPANSFRGRASRLASPDFSRSPRRNNFNVFGYQSMTYDPASDQLTLTRANHSAIQQDIIGIKTMLLTLKRVLNESESHDSLKSCSENSTDSCRNQNNNNEFRLELADLKRQVLFLQGQLEDKEKMVSNLQKRIDDLSLESTQNHLDNAPILRCETQNTCNAATQTERARPLSTGAFSVTSSPIEDNNPILRLMVGQT